MEEGHGECTRFTGHRSRERHRPRDGKTAGGGRGRRDHRGSQRSRRSGGRRRMAARHSGSIVNLSSTSAACAMPLLAYGPGKAAISSLTAILAVELGPDNVRVNAVMPGYVLTEQMQMRIDAGKRDPRSMKNHSALGRMVSPGDVANGIHFLCSDAASLHYRHRVAGGCGLSRRHHLRASSWARRRSSA